VAERRAAILAWQVLVGVAALSLWQGLVSLKILDPFFVSRPTDIAARVVAWVVGGTIWRHLATTLEESLLGLLIGSAMGISLGFSLGRSPLLARVFDPYIKMLNAVPRVVLAPLFLLWFGLGIWSKVALAVTQEDVGQQHLRRGPGAGDADDAPLQVADFRHRGGALRRRRKHHPGKSQHRDERHELPALGRHLNRMVVKAGHDVGAAANQRLQRLRPTREILQLDVDALIAVVPQFLRKRRRQVNHLALAAYSNPDARARAFVARTPGIHGGHGGHKGNRGNRGHKGRKQRKG